MTRVLILVCAAVILMPLLSCQTGPGEGPYTLATYTKTGGIAGLDERLVVRSDGSLVLQDRRGGDAISAQVDPGTLDTLRELLASPELADTQGIYRGDPGGVDLITYTIEAQLPTRRHTVVTEDTALHPPIVQRVIGELERLAQLARERERP